MECGQGAAEGEIKEHRNRILSNTAFRCLDHIQWRSHQIRKVEEQIARNLVSENELYGSLVKEVESLHQNEFPSRAENRDEAEIQLRMMTSKMSLAMSTLTQMAKQLMSILALYCSDTALSIVDALEDYGALGGLEALRRLHSDQKAHLVPENKCPP